MCAFQDFGEFMRENRLAPFAESSLDPSGKAPAERAKAQLERHTRYWPMIISQTTILNMQAVRTLQCFLFSSLFHWQFYICVHYVLAKSSAHLECPVTSG